MKTNIDLDEDLVRRAKSVTGLQSKKAVVEEGLRTILRLHGQRQVRDLRGRLRWEDPAPAPAAGAGPGAEPGSGDADPR